MPRHYSAKVWLSGAGRFAIWWFAVIGIAFPLVVLLLGYSLREGVALIEASPRFFIIFGLAPFPIIAIIVAEDLLQS